MQIRHWLAWRHAYKQLLGTIPQLDEEHRTKFFALGSLYFRRIVTPYVFMNEDRAFYLLFDEFTGPSMYYYAGQFPPSTTRLGKYKEAIDEMKAIVVFSCYSKV